MNSSTPASQPESPLAASQTAAFQFKLQYSREDAATLLGVSLRTMDRLIAMKQITVRRIGRRVLIPYSAMEQFIKRDRITELK
jgi:excisionase family DNA binding protein